MQLAVRVDSLVAAKTLCMLTKVDVNTAHPLIGGVPLTTAVRCRNLAMIRLLVDQGANVNAMNEDGTSALLVACNLGDLEIVTTLLSAGADVNYSNPRDNCTPLYGAVNSQ